MPDIRPLSASARAAEDAILTAAKAAMAADAAKNHPGLTWEAIAEAVRIEYVRKVGPVVMSVFPQIWSAAQLALSIQDN